MKPNRRNLIVLLLLLLLAVILLGRKGQESVPALGGDKNSPEFKAAEDTERVQGTIKLGAAAPAFSLIGLDGKKYEVGGKRDKALLLNFWASWCDPCKKEAPKLVALAEKYKDSLDIYAVNVTFYDSLDNVKAFVEKYGYTFPVLLDEKEEVYRKFNGMGFPINVLIDKQGNVQDFILGFPPTDAQIQELLNP